MVAKRARIEHSALVELKPWPEDFARKKAGIGCPHCDHGRVEETSYGVRYFAGETADGYLQKSGPTPGYSVVVFRGRHVGSPQEMTPDEHATFWSEVGAVAAAIEAVYRPVHLNFQILGNQNPHVHVHIVARYDPDPAPSMPLPEAAWLKSERLEENELRRQIDQLRSALSIGT